MESLRIIAGAGLAGTLAALECERRGLPFEVWDVGSGSGCTRAAAGLFNPLLGPRLSADAGPWDALRPFYRELERRLDAAFYHERTIERPLAGLKATLELPRSAPGWSAEVVGEVVRIRGGGWVDLPVLLDAARRRWARRGQLREAWLGAREAQGKKVLWCGGLQDFASDAWSQTPLVRGRWQAVRGDVLTVEAPEADPSQTIRIGTRFWLPLGGGRFRWGATHVSDDAGLEERPTVRQELEDELAAERGARDFRVVDYRWGVRPASRGKTPLVGPHPDEPGWALFNGFGGKGVSTIPRALAAMAWWFSP